MTSAPVKLWLMEDVWDQVLECCLKGDLARLARVSRSMHSLALDHLYRSITTLEPVLQFLGPTDGPSIFRHSGGGLVFTTNQGLEAANWDRFIPYANRVRNLTYDETQFAANSRPRVHESIFQEIGSTCPTRSLFPSLLSANLLWRGAPSRGRFSILFMSEKLQRLAIDCDAECARYFLRSIPKVSPNLETIVLHCLKSTISTEADLVDLIRGLPLLKVIDLPFQLLSSRTFAILSEHPQIQTIHQYSTQVNPENEPLIEGASYRLGLSAARFTRLGSLNISIDLASLIDWLKSDLIPSSLITLYVRLHTTTTHTPLRTCFDLISNALPDLVELSFDFYFHHRTTSGHATDIVEDTFDPLLRLKSLTIFVFDHPDPVLLADTEVEKMVKAWSNLKHLSLGVSSLGIDNQCILTLGVLIMVAECRPDLRSLSLSINTKLPPSKEPSGVEAFTYHSFKLNVGNSPIHDTKAVASFLCQILPHPGELMFCKELYGTVTGLEHMQRLFTLRRERWEESKAWLKPLTAARASERERMKQMLSSMASELAQARRELTRLGKLREGTTW
ncbi:hypothetical protein SISSUDRAFT_1126842 [Sistotremastrum suecicum HHB10207 ss-3]|uniref:F-box domain-containing protein n=1 Tax=Sistotremastrum suecicum HHB10207 ss-3 TaxID=1314776 RepID=A0A166FSE9_9AGAM|nr:hypothetical protein SISSUDRAFT_1126842 [Sistotremastrum suecicum HHB10207 ss-3]